MGFQDQIMLIVMLCVLIDHQARIGCGARDCQLLLQLGLSDDQKLDIILNFAQYNPVKIYCKIKMQLYKVCQ